MSQGVTQALQLARTVDTNVADASKWQAGMRALKEQFDRLSPDEKKEFLEAAQAEKIGSAGLVGKGGIDRPGGGFDLYSPTAKDVIQRIGR